MYPLFCNGTMTIDVCRTVRHPCFHTPLTIQLKQRCLVWIVISQSHRLWRDITFPLAHLLGHGTCAPAHLAFATHVGLGIRYVFLLFCFLFSVYVT